MSTTPTKTVPPFDAHLDEAYQRLRSALTAAMHTVRGGPTFPQDLARFLKINKNLAWRVSKIIDLHAPEQGIVHLPGPQGMKLLLKATESAGASAEVVGQVREAHEYFLEVIKVHAGDNETLNLLLDARPANGGVGSLENSRRLAFQGNSGVCGVQAESKFSAFFLAPSQTDPDKHDSHALNGFVNLVRLRDVDSVVLFRSRAFRQDVEKEPMDVVPIQPAAYELYEHIENFDKANLNISHSEIGATYALGRGLVGQKGKSSVVYSRTLYGRFPRYCDNVNRQGSLESTVEVPVRMMFFDIFVHKSLGYDRSMTLSLYHLPAGGLHVGEELESRDRLPIEIRPQALPGDPDACANSKIPGYSSYIRYANETYGFDLNEFTCVRFEVVYPPMHSTVSILFDLDEHE
jgi:hypothetical protein